LARTRLEEALKDPQLASHAETLKLDGELLTLAEKAWQAIPKGAAALTDGRHVVLLQTDGKKFEAGKGRKSVVKKVDEETIQIEQGIGGGSLTLKVPFSKLTPETLFDLARAGLPDDGEGKLALALMKLPAAQAGGSGKEAAEKGLRAFLDAAEKAAAPGAKVTALRGWLAFAEREQAAAQALRQVEKLIEAKDSEPAKAAWEAFRKGYSTTAFCAEVRPKFAELEERLRRAAIRLVIVTAFYGDLPNGQKTDVTAKVQAMVKDNTLSVVASNVNFGDPAPQHGKRLKVEYTFDGGAAKSKEVNENETLTISDNDG
jgi:hypothetical protein